MFSVSLVLMKLSCFFPQNGVFAEIERIKKRPFQRVTCMLHHCELPMRALFIFFDGPRTGKLLVAKSTNCGL